MLLKPIAKVDALCNSADVVGAMIPATPITIKPLLKETIVR